MEEQNNLEKQDVKRPWQGMTLVMLNILGILYLIYSIIFNPAIYEEEIVKGFESAEMNEVVMSEEVMQNAIQITFIIVVILLIILIILNIILTIGFYKGWKWALITNIIFIILFILFSAPGLLVLNYSLGFILFNFAIIIFELYLSIVCLRLPFYNKKK